MCQQYAALYSVHAKSYGDKGKKKKKTKLSKRSHYTGKCETPVISMLCGASSKRVKMSLSRAAEIGREEETRQKADPIVAIIGNKQLNNRE